MLGRAGIALTTGLIAGALTAQAQGSPDPVFRDCPQCPEMVPIAPGTFLMGASKADAKYTYGEQHANELPQHEVTIGYKFAISKFEVTVAEFAAYVAETGAKTGGECQLRTAESGPQAGRFIGTLKPDAEQMPPALATVSDADFRTPGAEVSDQHPATCISRREAKDYLDWLAKKTGKPYRFPTEAEWEYAIRAGSTTPYHYGGGPKDLCKFGNFADRKSPYSANVAAPCAEKPSPVATAPVGSYQPNAWGLHDMVGNAFEFIEDCSFDDYNGAPADGSPWRKAGCDAFVQRGYNFDSVAADMRSAARCLPGGWDFRGNNLTIRAAVSLDDTAWDRRQ